MVETISPVVHGDNRARYRLSIALHVLGTTVAAALVGALLGGFGWLLGAPWGPAGLVAVALVAFAYFAREAFGVGVPIPDARKQVPEWWRTFYSPPTTALLYGLGLGVGYATFLRHGTYVVVSFAALASGSPLLGLALCAPFGAARGMSVAASSRTGDAEAATDVLWERLQELASSPHPRRANAVVLAGIAIVATLTVLA